MKIALFVRRPCDIRFPGTGQATITPLERLGREALFPTARTCCGRMRLNPGYPDRPAWLLGGLSSCPMPPSATASAGVLALGNADVSAVMCADTADAVKSTAADVLGVLARRDPVRPRTFISGPCTTSDIEPSRVKGVRGSRTLEVVLT